MLRKSSASRRLGTKRLWLHRRPKQAAILRSDVLRLILLTARQVGKSTIAALRALFPALRHRNSLILMISPVGSQAGETLEKPPFSPLRSAFGSAVTGSTTNRCFFPTVPGSRLAPPYRFRCGATPRRGSSSSTTPHTGTRIPTKRTGRSESVVRVVKKSAQAAARPLCA